LSLKLSLIQILLLSFFLGLSFYGRDQLQAETEKKELEEPTVILLPDGRRVVDSGNWFSQHGFKPLDGREAKLFEQVELTPSGTSCKRENFDLFLQLFSEDLAFQYANM